MMDFKEASDRMQALGFTLHEQAAALGLAHQTLRTMRTPPERRGYRNPPPERVWRPAFGALIESRTKELSAFGGELTFGVAPSSPNPDGTGVAEVYVPGGTLRHKHLDAAEFTAYKSGDPETRESVLKRVSE